MQKKMVDLCMPGEALQWCAQPMRHRGRPGGRGGAVGGAGTIETVAALAVGGRGADDSSRDLQFSARQMRDMMRVLLGAHTREARLKLPGMQAPPPPPQHTVPPTAPPLV